VRPTALAAPDKRHSDEGGVKLSATVKEAVADAETEISADKWNKPLNVLSWRK
jgi:hypothetical protein